MMNILQMCSFIELKFFGNRGKIVRNINFIVMKITQNKILEVMKLNNFYLIWNHIRLIHEVYI